MVLKITIDIFSGRENPSVELTESESIEVLKGLKPGAKISTEEKIFPPVPPLGYKGLIIEQIGERDKSLPKLFRYVHGDLFGDGLAHKATEEKFEEFFCGSTGFIHKLELGREFPDIVKNEIVRFKELRVRLAPKILKFREKMLLPWWPCRWRCWRRCRCAPIYEPTWWNDGGQIQYNNNCYNYATNYRTDTFAQPGKASGQQVNNLSSCDPIAPAISAKMGAISDSLIDYPNAGNICPSEGHLVALAIWPNWDYHWYRKGRNNYWSHKPGGTQVTNLDNSGNSINDPRTADRGGYTEFCTFMIVKHGHIKIK